MRGKRTNHPLGRRTMAALLVICMLLTMPPAVAAEVETRTLTGFAALGDAVREQTVPHGTAREDLTLPDTLEATALVPAPAVPEEETPTEQPPAQETEPPAEQTPDSAPAEIIEDAESPLADAPAAETVFVAGVTWESTPAYDGAISGTYVFTPVLPAAYVPAAGISLPEITVTVAQAEPSVADHVIALIDALPTMDEWMAMEETAARAVMDEILAAKNAYDALTAEEQAQIDETRTAKLTELAEMAQQLANTMPMAAPSGGTLDFDTEGSTTPHTGTGYVWVESTKTLTLTDFNYTATDPVGIILPDGAALVLNGASSVASGDTTPPNSSHAVSCLGTLTVSGTGSLVATAGIGTMSTGVAVETNLILNSGSLTGIGGVGDASMGVLTSSGNITVNGGSLVGSAGTGMGVGVYAPTGAITVNSGSLIGKAAAEGTSFAVMAKTITPATDVVLKCNIGSSTGYTGDANIAAHDEFPLNTVYEGTGQTTIATDVKISKPDIASGTIGFSDTCSWRIDAEGKLTIYPTNGVSGTLLPNTSYSVSGTIYTWSEHAQSITSVVVEPGVKTADGKSYYLFSDLSNCLTMDLSGLDTSAATALTGMFMNCASLTELDISGLKTDKVMEMNGMFSGCAGLTGLNLSTLNTANVTGMSSMFNGCTGLKSITFGGSFTTPETKDMSTMFQNCKELTALDLSSFDTSKVTTMQQMFDGCEGLKTITFGNSFHTAEVTKMGSMFQNCKALTALDLSGFDTSKAEGLSYMFAYCEKLANIKLGTNFKTTVAKSISSMFYGCKSLTALDISSFDKLPSDTSAMFFSVPSTVLKTNVFRKDMRATQTYIYNKNLSDFPGITAYDVGSSTAPTLALRPYTITVTPPVNGSASLINTLTDAAAQAYFDKTAVFRVEGDPVYEAGKVYQQQGTYVNIRPAAELDSGYVVDTVTVTTKGGQKVEVTKLGDYGFFMPADDVTIAVTFALPPSLTVDVANKRIFAEGKEITIISGDYQKTVIQVNGQAATLEGLSGTPTAGYDLSDYAIYGGKNNEALTGDTNITMTGGTVSCIYGGGFGESGTVGGDRYVTVGGTAVVGAADKGVVIGRGTSWDDTTYVGVKDVTVQSDFTGKVYVVLPTDFDLNESSFTVATGVTQAMLDNKNLVLTGPGSTVPGVEQRLDEYGNLYMEPPMLYDSITSYDPYIFANGYPITIKAVGTEGKANVYFDHYRPQRPVTFSSVVPGNTVDGYDLTTCTIYGGAKDKDITGDTHITLEGGSVFAIFGGSRSGIGGGSSIGSQDTTLTGDTYVTIKGGTAGNVYGGGDSGRGKTNTITGTCHVTVEGGEVNTLYGGIYTVGAVDVRLTGGMTGTVHATSGGTTVNGSSTISITGDAVVYDVYAGGNYNSTFGTPPTLAVGGNVQIGAEMEVEGEWYGAGISLDPNGYDKGVSSFAISAPLTGKVYGLLYSDYDVSTRPTVVTGATAEDLKHFALTCDTVSDLGVKAAYLDGTEIKVKGGVTVTFDYDGATGGNTTATMPVYHGDPYGPLPAPGKSGYGFTGWYDAATGGKRVTKDTVLASDATDHTLYAQWGLTDPTVTLAADKTTADYTGSAAITLTATASHSAADAAFTYEWYKGGVKLEGKTASTLTLENVVDSGSYTVKVQAESGGLASAWIESNAVAVTIRYGNAPEGSFTLPGGFDGGVWGKDEVVVTGGAGYTVSTSLDGSFGASVTLDAEGSHTVTVYVKETSSGKLTQTEITYKLDKTNPAVGAVAGAPTDGWVKEAEITFAPSDGGSGVKTVTVTCSDGKSVTHDNDSFTADRNGTYTITVSDQAGNTATETVTVNKVDGTAPTASMSPAVDGSKWYGATTVTVTATDGGSGVKEYSFDGGENWQSEATKTFGSGAHTVTVWVKDNAGNITVLDPATLMVDAAIDGFVAKVGALGGTSTLQDLLVALTDYTANTHIAASDAGQAAYGTLTGYLTGKYGGMVTAINDIITAGGPTRADVDTANTLYDLLDAAHKAQVVTKAKLDALATAKDAAEDFASAVTTTPATWDELKKLVEDFGKLSDAAKSLLTAEEKTDYDALKAKHDAAKGFIDAVADITTPYIAATADKITAAGDKLAAVKTAGAEDFIPGKVMDRYTDAKDALDKTQGVEDKITALPDHAPGVDDCTDMDTHKPELEEAKLAYEKLTQNERGLIDGAATEKLNNQYDALMKYLNYVSKKDDVEVVGLAENVDTSGIGNPGDTVTIELSVEKKMPADDSAKAALEAAKATVVAGNPRVEQTGIYDVKLLAKVNGGAATEVQPDKAGGKSVVVRIKLASALKLDTLKIYHIHDGNPTPTSVPYALIQDQNVTYAVFEADQFSYFVLFAEQETVSPPVNPGTSGGSSAATKPEVTRSEHGSVAVTPESTKPGDKVTVTVKPDEGYVVDQITVTEKSGKEVAVKDNGDGTYTFIQPTGKVTIAVTFRPEQGGELPFADVSTEDWFYGNVAYVYGRGLMNGTTENTFSPYLGTDRGMIVTILWRMEGSPKVTTASFPDVAAGQYYTDAVAWGAENGIVKGYNNGNYGPTDPVTREQLAAILWRYAKYKGWDVSVGENTNILSYLDFPQISEYAIPALQWAVGGNIMNGKDNGILDPNGCATRAEAAAMLERLLSKEGQ